jgi:alkylhydroperoxidase family enzyme
VILTRGNVADGELADFLAAGFNEQQVLEVLLGVSLATLCNFANNLAGTGINPELQAYRPGALES